MAKLYKILLTFALCINTYSYADIQSTRQVLAGYSENNSKVLALYDELTESWSKYEKTHNNQWDISKLLLAVEYAAEKHVGQIRKDEAHTPYIFHPIGVSKLLWDIGNIRSLNVLIASILHDTLEDTNATEEEIQKLFGERVLYTINELTNDPNLSTEENKQRQVDHAPSMSLNAQLVKLADRLYNVRDLTPPPVGWSEEKIDQYYLWGEKLLHSLRGTNEPLENALKAEIKGRIAGRPFSLSL